MHNPTRISYSLIKTYFCNSNILMLKRLINYIESLVVTDEEFMDQMFELAELQEEYNKQEAVNAKIRQEIHDKEMEVNNLRVQNEWNKSRIRRGLPLIK